MLVFHFVLDTNHWNHVIAAGPRTKVNTFAPGGTKRPEAARFHPFNECATLRATNSSAARIRHKN